MVIRAYRCSQAEEAAAAASSFPGADRAGISSVTWLQSLPALRNSQSASVLSWRKGVAGTRTVTVRVGPAPSQGLSFSVSEHGITFFQLGGKAEMRACT